MSKGLSPAKFYRVRASCVGIAVLACLGLLPTAGAQSIPIEFDLPEDGRLTIVIEDESGRRVRNLLQDQYFPAGRHTVYWDGYDEGVPEHKPGGSYDITRRLVSPGNYRVKALRHQGIDLLYEFSVQSPGDPAWHTTDRSGAWLSDHSTPFEVVFIPEGARSEGPVLQVGALIAEAGHGVMIIDEDGRKQIGLSHVSNSFRFFEASTRDIGPDRDRLYMTWNALARGGVIRLVFMRDDGGGNAGQPQYTSSIAAETVRGIAAYNGWLAVSYDAGIAFFDVRDGKNGNYREIRVERLADIRGIETDGVHLYAVTRTTIDRFDVDWASGTLSNRTVLVRGLKDAKRIRLRENKILVSDHGRDHQIKVYDETGAFERSIGTPGGPQVGIYDESRMSRPMGFDIDSRGKVWVAEQAYMPKRLSVWDFETGEFDRAFYGSPKYGGGLVIDSLDSRRAYYSGAQTGLIEFGLDWVTGRSVPTRILHNRERSGISLPRTEKGSRVPQRVCVKNGERYFVTPAWSQSHAAVFSEMSIWHERADTIAWVGQIGRISNWIGMFDDVARYPEIAAYVQSNFRLYRETLFVWTDLNNDGDVSLNEFGFYDLGANLKLKYYLDQELNIHLSDGGYLPLSRVKSSGVPVYDIGSLTRGGYMGVSEEAQIIAGHGVLITSAGPLEGYRNGERLWSYHSQWPGRAAGAPVGRFEGDPVRTTRLIGDPASPPDGESGGVWAINSEHGEIYLFTTDGYFITTLLADNRTSPLWRYPAGVVTRGDEIGQVSPNDEHFWPFLSKGDDGNIYLTAGKAHSSIMRLSGWGDVRRHDFGTIGVAQDLLAGLPPERAEPRDLRRNREYEVPVTSGSVVIDGSLDEWSTDEWMTVDSLSNVRAALRVGDGHLFVAVASGNEALLSNDTSDPAYTFATGGAIDIHIGKSGATEDRTDAIEGDRRLIVTRSASNATSGSLVAVLFEQVSPGAPPGMSVTYESPIGTATLDYVASISDQVTLASSGGDYEFSVPVGVLGIEARPGVEMRADIGVLTGDGVETQARTYWNNTINTTVSDIPSEARIQPEHWGRWLLVEKETANLPPSGLIVSPTEGATIPLGPTSVEVEVGDPDGEVSRVQLRVNGSVVDESTTAPYALTWNPVAPGPYKLKIRVFDAMGAAAASGAVSVSVEESPAAEVNAGRIALDSGWNIVSSAVVPTDDRVESVLADVLSDVLLVKDDEGNVFSDEFGIDTIVRWDAERAYMIYADRKVELVVQGDSVVSATRPIKLSRGWNFVPFYPATPMAVEDAFAGIDHLIAVAKDHAGNVFIPEFGLNDIGQLKPGSGYKVYVTEGVRLVYPEIDTRAKFEASALAVQGAGFSSALLVIDGPGRAGEELEVRTENGVVVGSGTVGSDGRAFVAVRADEMLTEHLAEGAKPGQKLVLLSDGRSVEVDSVHDMLSASDDGNEIYFGFDRLLYVEIVEPVTTFDVGQNYPNPFVGSTSIKYSVPEEMNVTLEVFDATGRLVRRLAHGLHASGTHSVEFDSRGLASGAYVYRARTDGQSITRLLTVIR